MAGPRAFVSYARADAERVATIEKRLRQLDYDVWLDLALKGGQAWWDEILSRIRQCDVFIAVVSPASLNSRACAREREYADALGKPVLPVGIVPLGPALPTELSRRQVVDYSTPGEDAAFRLAAVLTTMPSAPPLPDPLPEPPEVPLSYLASLVDLASGSDAISKSQQLDVLDELEGGLRASDSDEREGAWHVLALLEERGDLYAATQRRIDRLRESYPRAPTASPTDAAKPAPEGVGSEAASPPGPQDDDGERRDAVPPERQRQAGPPPPHPAEQGPPAWTAPPAGGAAPPPPRTPPAGGPGPPPPNFLVWAIVVTVLCCLPLGVVSIVYASQVNTKWAQGDADGARQSAARAKTFAIWGAAVGAVVIVLWLLYVLAVAGSDGFVY